MLKIKMVNPFIYTKTEGAGKKKNMFKNFLDLIEYESNALYFRP